MLCSRKGTYYASPMIGLRLPSEDEAIRVYRETYGKDFERTKKD